jgi:hypothetical protein
MQWYKNRIYYWKHSKCVRKETKDEPAKDGGLSQQWWTWLVGWWWMIGALGFGFWVVVQEMKNLDLIIILGPPKIAAILWCINPTTFMFADVLFYLLLKIIGYIWNDKTIINSHTHKVEWLTISAFSASWANTSGQT